MSVHEGSIPSDGYDSMDTDGSIDSTRDATTINPQACYHTGDRLPPLVAAVHRNDLQAVGRLLDIQGADIELREPSLGRTGLHIAVQFGQFDMVELLLHSGASVTAVSPRGETILNIAALGGTALVYERIIHTLLLHGADIHQLGCMQRTALHTAVISASSKVVSMLLTYGADVSAQDIMGHNSLHCVAWRRASSLVVRQKITRILLAHGTNVGAKIDIMVATATDMPTNTGSDSEDTAEFTPEQIAEPSIRRIMREAFTLLVEQYADIQSVDEARFELARRAKLTAFSMGHHQRLGHDSPVLTLSPDMLKMVLQYV